MNKTFFIAAAAAFVLSAGAAAAQDAAAGEAVFKQRCAACHAAPGPGSANRVGPQLNGVVGRKAASVADYPRYSQLAKDAAPTTDTWDADELFTYLADPTAALRAKTGATAGASTMTFKLADEAARKNVIAYLAQFDEAGAKK